MLLCDKPLDAADAARLKAALEKRLAAMKIDGIQVTVEAGAASVAFASAAPLSGDRRATLETLACVRGEIDLYLLANPPERPKYPEGAAGVAWIDGWPDFPQQDEVFRR